MANSSEKKTSNELVVHSNDFNRYPLASLTPTENKIFHSIVAKIKNKDTESVTLTYDELKSLTGYTRNGSAAEFTESLKNVNSKIMQIQFTYENEAEIDQFTLFPTFRINKIDQSLSVAVNQQYTHFFNQLTGGFTAYELDRFVSLDNKYSLLIYPLLMQWKSTGKYSVDIEEFKKMMGLKENVRADYLEERVLKSAITEINECIPGFNLKVEKKRGARNKIIGLEFTFDGRLIRNMKRSDGRPIDAEFTDVSEKLSRETKIARMFGVLEPNRKEQKTISEWIKRNISDEMIEDCIKYAGEKANIRYCNVVLLSWNDKGYIVPSDVPELVEAGIAADPNDLLQQSMFDVPEYE